MPTRVMTPIQVDRVAKTLTALATVLNQVGFPWPPEAQTDLRVAYESLGVDMPFDFVTKPVDAPVEPLPEGMTAETIQ